MVASNTLVLLIFSRSSLLYKSISVSWALLKSNILGTIQLTVLTTADYTKLQVADKPILLNPNSYQNIDSM